MLEHKTSWEVLKIFAKECSNNHHDIGLTWKYFMARSNCFPGLEFMEHVEDFGAKVYKLK